MDESETIKNNTVVTLMSDHGWKLGEFKMWGKHSVLHTDLHVPLIVRHPEMQSRGAHTFAIVELVDLFPTLADLAGVSKIRSLTINCRSQLKILQFLSFVFLIG
jgi:iduronate 2-sulfatase